LDAECALNVSEAAAGDEVRPGRALIAPGDFHVALRRDGVAVRAVLNQEPPQNSCRPAVDVLFRSAAEIYGDGCLGVVLTGMGQDGLRGARHIVERGGAVMAQDQETSVVWGMPRAVAEDGIAEKTLPLSAIPEQLVRAVTIGRRLAVTS
jgi:two-component system chemotaxis response regulator CheB